MDGLLRRWILAFTLGELIGFGGIPVLGAAAALSLTADLEPTARTLTLYVVSVLGGLGEGAVLAWFQLRVLSRLWPALSHRRFIVATALAASFAWACGMLPSTLDDLFGLTAGQMMSLWIPCSVAILMSIGSAQALVLRRVVARPGRWVWANVLGWLAGLPFTFLLPAALPETAPMWAWIVCFVVAGVLMGGTAGLITGLFLRRARYPDGPTD